MHLDYNGCEWFLFAGEFVKYHDLKDKDELIVYRDGVGKLVRASFCF